MVIYIVILDGVATEYTDYDDAVATGGEPVQYQRSFFVEGDKTKEKFSEFEDANRRSSALKAANKFTILAETI